MNKQSGYLSIESKNIFSILKKWLYTEQDIVFRELISNASDAIEKLVTLQEKGEAVKESSAARIVVTLDTEANCIIISDNGIGMTEAEVDQYINQIAFSGAADFINQHSQEQTDSIIGHFGVGFYSAFMLADHVAIETKSYQENASAVRWDCKSDMSYEMKPGTRTQHGTDVILYMNDPNPYMSKPETVYNIIKKYFMFLQTEVYFEAPEFDKVFVNDTNPIWKQPDSAIVPEEMNNFYKEFYNDIADPLFWIKFESIDIGISGIIFFRNTKNGTEELDGSFKIYNRGVYVGENIKELVPKFVNLQSGIIDCKNLPLVVSRSTIREDEQKDDMASLIYECLSQEVTIALNSFFEKNRKQYETFWPHLNAFVKYGIMQDKIFASVMTRKVIFEDIYGRYRTIQEYIDDETNADKGIVYYASEAIEQSHYIEIFKRCKLNALLFDHVIDQPFLRRQEVVHSNIQFVRIDSNIESLFQGSLNGDDAAKVELLTQKIHHGLGERLGKMELKITNLAEDSITTLIVNDEKSRRMADMMEMYGLIKGTDHSIKEMQSKRTLLVNLNNDIVRFILKSEDKSQADLIINQLFDLALMSQGTLNLNDVESFILRSETMIHKLIRSC
ncbi:molecular chaperone HtpG [Sinanaerobacter chloroacetimidivorans]|uniref:Molecular chaperone HtpG n=1 Tax=Sinanaerobacter chloroacetimidivorans TaxID=2818044 RepID=A0A8J8B1K3_9FIRM|nr:molecular chaperone HtpG [Sinanaerobacter chloroacetimidivorans]MBR0597761.1 molecular chaperone HtpG [Sinanaerobacter chloroacetimidivorans]